MRACRLRVDSSSLMPPLRKWIPGTAAGMERSIVRTVYLATSAGGGVGTSRPAQVVRSDGFDSHCKLQMTPKTYPSI